MRLILSANLRHYITMECTSQMLAGLMARSASVNGLFIFLPVSVFIVTNVTLGWQPVEFFQENHLHMLFL